MLSSPLYTPFWLSCPKEIRWLAPWDIQSDIT